MKQVPSFLHTHNRTSQSSTTQNDDKLDAQNAAYDEKLKQARQLELDREQAALEKQLNEKRRLEKQEMLRNELQQQISREPKIKMTTG